MDLPDPAAAPAAGHVDRSRLGPAHAAGPPRPAASEDLRQIANLALAKAIRSYRESAAPQLRRLDPPIPVSLMTGYSVPTAGYSVPTEGQSS
jgi:hypothetical protein